MKKGFNKQLSIIIKALIFLFAYLFFIHKISNFQHWSILTFSRASGTQLIAFILVILLAPLNISCEAWHWKFSLSAYRKTPLKQSFRSVLGGIIPGIITPGRIGEWPGRALFFEKGIRNKITGIALYAGFIKTITLLIWGNVALLGTWYFGGLHFPTPLNALIIPTILITAALATLFLFSKQIGLQLSKLKWIEPIALLNINSDWNNINYRLSSFGISSLRVLIFCMQFALLMYALNTNLGSPEVLWLIPVYFMTLTLLPVFTLAEPGIRGSVALLLFSGLTTELELIGIAGVLLWFINNTLPIILGSLIWIKRT